MKYVRTCEKTNGKKERRNSLSNLLQHVSCYEDEVLPSHNTPRMLSHMNVLSNITVLFAHFYGHLLTLSASIQLSALSPAAPTHQLFGMQDVTEMKCTQIY